MTLHIIDVEQGSEEWHDQRRGVLTASVVGRLITTCPPDATTIACPACNAEANNPCLSMAASKTPTPIKTVHIGRTAAASELPPVHTVADNDTSRALTATLVAERITGWTEDVRITDDMWRGTMHEPFARDVYSGHYHQAVEVGLMLREEDGWTLGYSPDGVVADDGLVEIKCPRAKTHLNTILADEVPAHYMPQLQAGLLVSGRQWIDFVSFVGGMPLYCKRVYPNPAWFGVIVAACQRFEKTAAEMGAAYQQATKNRPATERVPELMEMSL